MHSLASRIPMLSSPCTWGILKECNQKALFPNPKYTYLYIYILDNIHLKRTRLVAGAFAGGRGTSPKRDGGGFAWLLESVLLMNQRAELK